MKNRWLIGLATAAMAVTMAFGFVACGDDTTEPDPVPGPGGTVDDGGETLTDSEIAKRAINTVKGLYGSTEVQTTGADYQVLGQTKVGGKTYTYDWSVSSTFEGYENYVTVGELVGNYVTIGIKKATVEIEYTLKASVTVGEATESIEFLKKIPKGEERTEETVTKSLAFSMDTRTSTEAAKQVYEQNGVTVTNLKGSGSDINSSYYGRFYKGSVVQIEFPGILHVDFHTHPGYDDSNYSEELQKSLLAAYPDAKIEVTDGETEDLVSFELGSATDVVEFTCTAQIRMDSIDVEGKAGGASAADKVKSAKSTLKLSQQNYFELDTIALPTEENGVSVSWALSGSSDYVNVSENKLNVTSLPDSGSAQATLTATLKLEEEQDTKDVTITLLPAPTLTNDGTAAHPYTAVEALTVTNLVDDDGYYSKSGAPRAVYVTGYVVNIGSWNSDFSNWNNVYIADSAASTKDSEDAIQIFRMVPNDVLTEGNLQLGAKITVVGFLQNYKGNTPEITFNGDTSVTASSYTPPTDDQQIKNALAAVPETLTVSSTGVTTLPASTVPAVTFSWALKDGNSLPEGSSYAEGKITVTTLPAEEKQVVFTVTATCGSEPAQTKDVTVTITPGGSTTEGFTPISAPAAGSDYYLAMDINGTWYYSTGAMAGHFLGTTTDISAAAKVTVAASGNGWTLQTNGKYLEIQKVDGYNNIVLADAQTAGQVWVWDESHAVFTMTVGTDTFFMGTYGDYTTFNAAFVSYLDKDNEYIGKIGTYSGSEAPEPGPGGETTGDFTAITAPQAGSNYYMSMKIADGKEHYLTGSLDGQGYYLTTTTELSQAAKVELRADGAGWLILVGGKYLELKLSSDKTHANPVLLSAQTSNMHWEWDETNKIFTWTDENNTKWFLGTRSDRTFDTVGGCDYEKYVAENYKAVVGTVGGEGGGGGDEPTHVCGHVCEICGKCTDNACEDPVCADKCGGHTLVETDFTTTEITELKALVSESGKTTTEKYFAIGIVKSIKDDYNSEIYIVDEQGNELLVYRLLNEDGTTVLQTPSTLFTEGDTIVVYGVMTNYNGTIEMQYAWLVQINSEAKTDEAKLLLLTVSLPAVVDKDFDLPVVEGVTYAVQSGEGIKIQENKATVTRTDARQEVVIRATASVHEKTATKDFTVVVKQTITDSEEISVTVGQLLAGQSPNAYSASGSNPVDCYMFSWTDVGNYGLIQMRKTKPSSFWNTDAFTLSISKVEITWASKQQASTDNLKIELSNNKDFTSAQSVTVSAVVGQKAEVTASGTDYVYIRVTQNGNYAVYIDEVKIICAKQTSEPETAQQKVENALKEVSDEYTVTAAGDYNLPTSTVGEVTFSWAVDAEHADTYPVENGVLKVGDSLPDVETRLTLTLTAKCGEEYTTTKQVTIIISAKESGPVTPSGSEVIFDLETACTATGGTLLSDEAAKELFDTASNNSEELIYLTVAAVYEGTGAGGAKGNTSILKMGSSGNGGQIKLVFNKVVTSVTLKAQDFATSGTAKTISVNGSEEKSLSIGSSSDLTFSLTDSTTIVTITSSERAYIYSIKVTLSDDTTVNESAKIVDALSFVPDSINVKEAGDYVLPTSMYSDVHFAWVSGNETYPIKDDTKLDVKELPKAEVANFELTLTATCGNGEQKTKQVAVSVDKYAPKLTFNFALITDNAPSTTAMQTNEELKTYLEGAIAGQSLLANFTNCSIDGTDNSVYNGDSSNGKYTLKLGKSKGNGKVTLNFSENVTKVVIEWKGHSTSEGALTVNDTQKSNDGTTMSTTIKSQEWVLSSPSTSVTIGSAKRAYISSIIVYFEAEA